jgi:hypothetical protein
LERTARQRLNSLEKLEPRLSIAMGRPSHLNWLLAASILLAGCSSSALKSERDQGSRAAIERLELRLNQLEQQLNDVKRHSTPL